MLVRGVNHVVDYVDDLLVHTPTWEEDVRTLRELFRRLQKANFSVRPINCVLGTKRITFLGLEEEAINLQEENVEKVPDCVKTKNEEGSSIFRFS
ncbi:transposon tf2-12 polyprotein [Plakobranchus ocellatus]|uniref:Transposon tf2-12 polyprotein n=1 Tax=Plakobranchus ocellatus TaxID=259542 RepID=A0AAV4B3K6_9GAST|nr:transposon tf2-12 polyprotein [Plakobranchus ocellatus]